MLGGSFGVSVFFGFFFGGRWTLVRSGWFRDLEFLVCGELRFSVYRF